MNGLVLEGWELVGVIAAASGLATLVGVALGYYTASRDLDAERATAWARGRADWRAGRFRNPYQRQALAPAPTVHRVPQPRQPQFFDQEDDRNSFTWAADNEQAAQ